MKQLPKGGLIGKSFALARLVARWNIPTYAAGTCYFLGLSVFPALVLLLALLRYTAFRVEDLLEVLEGVVPNALLPFIASLFRNAYDHSSETMISLSAVVTLWSASRGIYGLHRGLNAVYGVEETRGYLAVNVMCMIYTFLFMLVIVLTLVLHVFGSTILGYIMLSDHLLLAFLSDAIDFRFFLLLGIQTFVFAVMYMCLPNDRNSFRSCLPGAVLASMGWLVLSDGFTMYVERVQRYASIFGSVYAVALSMIWLYLCITIVFYGGALNHILKDRKK